MRVEGLHTEAYIVRWEPDLSKNCKVGNVPLVGKEMQMI